jgi:hypothetical protein
VVLAQVVVANVIMLEVAANVLAPGDHSKIQMTQVVSVQEVRTRFDYICSPSCCLLLSITLKCNTYQQMSGTRGAAKKPNSSSATQEVLPVQDTSSQGGGGGEQIEDTSSEGGGGGEQIDTTSSSQDVDAHQALCRPHDDDAPTPKQLALAHAIKAHYDNHCR